MGTGSHVDAASSRAVGLSDTLRAQQLGLYGYSRDTSPTLDALGREGAFLEYAISQAACGHFDQAVTTQRQLLAMAGWMAPPDALAEIEKDLAAFEQQSLAIEPWPATDPLLAPPPFDPLAPFRDYPAAVPH